MSKVQPSGVVPAPPAPPLPPPSVPPPDDLLAFLDCFDQEPQDEAPAPSAASSDAGPKPPLLPDLCGRQSWIAVGGVFAPTDGLVRVSNDDLQEAALRGDLGLVRRLINAGASVNAPMRPEADDEFLTMLHILASKPEMPNGTRIICEIIESRANLNARSLTGSTPLVHACSHKHLGAIEVLLDRKADLMPVNDYGRNACSCSVLIPKDRARDDGMTVEALKLLHRAGADLDDGGDTPVMTEAVKQGNILAMNMLLELGATPTGLHEAVEVGPLDMIKTLIGAMANPFLKDQQGNTVMDMALNRGHEEIKALLRDFIGDLQRQQHPHCQTMVQLSSDSDHVDEELVKPTRYTKFGRKTWKITKPEHVWYHIYSRQWRERCRTLMKQRWYGPAMFFNLMFAIYLPDLWILSDTRGDATLDHLLAVIILVCAVEVIVQLLAKKSYLFSFFFWTDLFGCFSVAVDMTFVIDLLPSAGANSGVLLRAARFAKLGTRAGRSTKLIKLLRFLPGMQLAGTHHVTTAKVISNTLNTALSIRVCGVIIIMVTLSPVFESYRFPYSDSSMRSWMAVLGDVCKNVPADIPLTLREFQDFYTEKDYKPFAAWCTGADGVEQFYKLSDARPPARDRNSIEVKDGTARSHFNFTMATQVESFCNLLMVTVIIFMMTGASVILTHAVSGIVLTPLEILLGDVKERAHTIFNSVAMMSSKFQKAEQDDRSDDGADVNNPFGSETLLLEKVVKKLTALTAIATRMSPLDEQSLLHMSDNDRAIVEGYTFSTAPSKASPTSCHPNAPQDTLTPYDAHRASHDTRGSGHHSHLDIPTADQSRYSKGSKQSLHVTCISDTIEHTLGEVNLKWGHLYQWDFDVLVLDERQRSAMCMGLFLYERGITGTSYSALLGTYRCFIDTALQGYGNPARVHYHNWSHAVDICWLMHRIMNLCGAVHFLRQHERFALIVSALCHDLGHPGVNNDFLVKTAHELAIRYNDHSPLEMMHCARMFEISRQSGSGVFNDLGEELMPEVRSTCVQAILDTDNVHHYSSMKSIQIIYETNSESFDAVTELHRAHQLEFPSKEAVDNFSEPGTRKTLRSTFLRLCDISNPSKPWKLCHIWSNKVMEEFFQQGDREKELGLVVQPLHDRSKVNIPHSQVGFIEFFVAPFVFAIERVLFPMEIIGDELLKNLDVWFNEWVNWTVPKPDQEEQAKVLERITKLVLKHNGLTHL